MAQPIAPYVGRSLRRREDRRLLTGQGQFVADLVLPRMLHAVFVRSPLAHARIRAVDLSQAGEAPGVALALSGPDLAQLVPPVAEGQIRVPSKWTTVVQHESLNPQQPLLAHDKVRHVGEAVAIIVAETRYQAEDAAELVGLDQLGGVLGLVAVSATMIATASANADLVVREQRLLRVRNLCWTTVVHLLGTRIWPSATGGTSCGWGRTMATQARGPPPPATDRLRGCGHAPAGCVRTPRGASGRRGISKQTACWSEAAGPPAAAANGRHREQSAEPSFSPISL